MISPILTTFWIWGSIIFESYKSESDAGIIFLQPAYYNLGVVYSEMMQYDVALTCYERAALERPMYAEAYCNMGVIFKNRGDLESAIACYERCPISFLINFFILIVTIFECLSGVI